MKYQIIVSNFKNEFIDSLDGVYDISFSTKIQSDGKFSFKIDWADKQNTTETIKMFNLIVIERYNSKKNIWQNIYAGFIEDIDLKENFIEVRGDGLLKFFKHRYSRSTDTIIGEKAENVIDDLLNYSIGLGDSPPFEMGIKDADILVDFNLTRQRLNETFMNVAAAAGKDIWIDENLKVNIGNRGENKSELEGITFDYYLPETINTNGINASYSSLDFANRIIGRSNSIESIQEIAHQDFPMIEKVQSFSGIASVETLDMRTIEFLKDLSSVVPSISVQPINADIMLDEYTVGDYVSVYCRFKGRIIEAEMRIVEIKNKIDDNGADNLSISLSQSRNVKTTLIDVISRMESKVNAII